MIHAGLPSRRLLTALLLASLPATPALAFWELTPQLEAGVTYESNPRYFSDQEKAILEELNPGITDSVMGIFLDARVQGIYKTPSNTLSLSPRIRQTNYLESNKDLNDDDWYVDFLAAHEGALGSAQLDASYQETGVRTSEFESATPDNPDDPPPVSSGSGRFSDDTQQTWSIRPSLNYQLSALNLAGVSGQFSETTYDEDRETLIGSRGYLDFSYSSVDVYLRHVLNARNYFELALNGGNFLADEEGRLFRNSTDSFGISATYNWIYSDTLTATLNAGLTRSSVDVSGIIGGFDPLTGALCQPAAPCSTSNEERNFVGSLELRKRTELTTLNFSLASQIAPRSDGTEVVQDQARLFVDRVLTRRLSGRLGVLYSMETAVGQVFQPETATIGLARQDRDFLTVESRLSWQLTSTLSVFGAYTYATNETDVTTGNVDETNNRLYFGVLYRGVGLRR